MTLYSLPNDLFYTLIFPELTLFDIHQISFVNKAMYELVKLYDGHGHIEEYYPSDKGPDIEAQMTKLIAKFPQMLYTVSEREELNSENAFNLSKFADYIESYSCRNTMRIPLVTIPRLQFLQISGKNPRLRELPRVYDELYPVLRTIWFCDLVTSSPIHIQFSKSLRHIYIEFRREAVPVYIANLPNLTELSIEMEDNAMDFEGMSLFDVYIQPHNMGGPIIILDVPKISVLTITNYNLTLTLPRFSNLTELHLVRVNYIQEDKSTLFQINFNKVFPHLRKLSIVGSGTAIFGEDGWPPVHSVLHDLSNLEGLQLEDIWGLEAIGSLTNIEFINILHCDYLRTIKSVTSIDTMYITNCKNLAIDFDQSEVKHLIFNGSNAKTVDMRDLSNNAAPTPFP